MFGHFPRADEYREMLEYLNGLYGRGLILEDIFSIDRAKFNTFGTDGLLASCATQTPAGFFGDEGDNYVPLRPLTKTSGDRSEEHTSELQSRGHLVCRLLLETKKQLRAGGQT